MPTLRGAREHTSALLPALRRRELSAAEMLVVRGKQMSALLRVSRFGEGSGRSLMCVERRDVERD
jgi:hypothetical protein